MRDVYISNLLWRNRLSHERLFKTLSITKLTTAIESSNVAQQKKQVKHDQYDDGYDTSGFDDLFCRLQVFRHCLTLVARVTAVALAEGCLRCLVDATVPFSRASYESAFVDSVLTLVTIII